ncbi:hypothetical protein M231_00043 [Tremella mesenterica]|uniref:Uncharacterized protein n=1 Tax=Tremella mesenterica TaxID=5217 RepID=A0A4Q1BWE8_TREME|nr:hypothetical protein M231_00043 [Tremella mesenterica]
MTSNLWLPAVSPLFFYSPSPTYFSSSSFTASWTTLLDPSLPSGNNTAAQTSGPAGVILPSIYATTFTPIWEETNDYAVQVAQGSQPAYPWVSGNTTDVSSFGVQTYELGVQCGSGDCSQSPFTFRGAWVETYYSPAGSEQQNVTIDDASNAITYAGFSSANTQAMVPVGSQDHQGTLSETTTSGATANVTFQGASILIVGAVSPNLGTFTITVDSVLTATLSASSNVQAHSVPLFFTSNLDTTQKHLVSIQCTGAGLVIDSMTIWGPSGGVSFYGPDGTPIGGSTGSSTSTSATLTNPSSSASASGDTLPGATTTATPNVGAIVGGVLGGLLALVGYLN